MRNQAVVKAPMSGDMLGPIGARPPELTFAPPRPG